ncbi:hypothetical protein NDU88_002503 [Pleurodeles waltl]|uniref:Uncharacterized protein n=1 Tax=Pleurodeles waltl TaxID=8319 RepID=A0AAV7T2L4_PLEWA|nr:hypothetical protein NDU88_002503 [Pleurodeles waltl]
MNGSVAQEKRTANNERASCRQRAVKPSIQVGHRAIICDRHPMWKDRTMFEREAWEVVRVKGTMITAKRGTIQMAQNMLWFKKITETGAGFGEEGEDDDLEVAGVPMNGVEYG